MTPEMLSIRARIAANARLAKHGATEATRPMRQAAETALNTRLIAEHGLDVTAPDFPARLKFARSAHYGAMALKGAKTLARKQEASQ